MPTQIEFRKMDFESLVVKPIQRLPKYVLLLKDLVKHTDDSHPDYNPIKKALALFEKVNNDNNENLDKYINNQKMFELQR